ncbi:MAG: hypothetical protein KAS53_12160 [Candidatus Cloacimonetes bacterium]|nr:hypothetical protein [Candidatus Cloacimonadota bacterium]
MKFFEAKWFLILLILILFLLYFSPYLIKGKNSYILIHDNLNQLNMQGIFDGKMSAQFFPNENVKEYTLPGTEPIFHLAHIKFDKIFLKFGYFRGFILNEFFYRLLGFLGLLFLLKIYLLKKQFPDFFLILFSFAFISLPFWPQGNLSIAGIPLLILAFLNLYFKKYFILSFLIIILYAFYSNIFFVGFFLEFIIFSSFIYLLLKKEFNTYLLLGGIILFLCYILSHYPIFLNEFIYKIPTNRHSQFLTGYGVIDSIKAMIFHFIYSQKLSHSLHTYLIFPSTILITALIIYNKDKKWMKIISLLWVVLLMSSIFYGLFYFQPLLNIYNKIGFGFRFDRIYVLNPILWYTLFGLSLSYLFISFKNKRLAHFFILLLIIPQIGINFSRSTLKAYNEHPTFKEFMSEKQFDEIEQKLDGYKEDFQIGCIGFFPSVANYNGFKTIGSFSAYYPVEFKEKFYKIIKPELGQNQYLKDYFINKGSALFLFDDKIEKHYYDQEYIQQNISKITCDLDIEELKKINVKYLFSTTRIQNASEIGLEEIIISESLEYYYRLFIYKMY